MWTYHYSARNYLYHYGVLGMKWGVRKEQTKAYKQKLTALTKNKNITNTDAKRFEYRNQHVAKRIGKSAATAAIQVVLADVMSGNAAKYHLMSKKDVAKRLTQVASTTAANVLIADALAKSASKKYGADGKLLPGNKKTFATKEDAIEVGVTVGLMAIPAAAVMLNLKAAALSNRQARVDRWGQNILTDKVDNVIWQSPDFKTAVIDNRGR